MAITQTITSVEQSGGNHSVYNAAEDEAFNGTQLICFSILLAIVIYFIFRLLDNAITKTCMGCKRLKECERRLKQLEKERDV